MRGFVLSASMFLLAACTNACGAHGGPRVPDALEQYERDFEVRRYTGVTLAGVELWQATPRNVCCDQEPRIDVYGFDSAGRAVPALELVRRLGERPAADLVGPVSEILLHQPHRALSPDDEEVNSQFISDAERPLIEAPSLVEGVLTYFVMQGSMAPQLVRIRVTLATGDVVRDWTRQLVAPPPEPREVVLRRDLSSPVEGPVRAALQSLLAEPRSDVTTEVLEVARGTLPRDLRVLALTVLARTPDASRVPDLAALLARDADPEIRTGVVRALAAIGTPEAVLAVRRAASSASVADAQRYYGILQAAGVR